MMGHVKPLPWGWGSQAQYPRSDERGLTAASSAAHPQDQARTYLLNQSIVRCQAKSAAGLL
jgi:hypothetical protein